MLWHSALGCVAGLKLQPCISRPVFGDAFARKRWRSAVFKPFGSRLSATLIACLLGTATASAHATLEVQQAPVNSGYKAVMRVPHGCNGSATLKVRIQIPEGYIGVKPMPKAGWTLETVRGKYAKEYQSYHAKISEGVKEVIWTGKLLDENYDEFVVSGQLASDLQPGTVMYFPTVQECEVGVHRWIEIPEAGKSAHDYKEPAPALKLLPPAN